MQNNSGQTEWHTPEWLVKRIRKFYGNRIDLDPATSQAANEKIKASNYFIKDGEKQRWYEKRVFINPPYKDVGVFSDKVLKSLTIETNQTILWLSNNNTETRAVNNLIRHCEACLFIRTRLRFEGPHARFKIVNGKVRYEQALQGQVLILLTNNTLKSIGITHRFAEIFKDVGKTLISNPMLP